MNPIRFDGGRRITSGMLSPAVAEGSTPDPHRTLLSRVAGGDESALAELLETVGPRVLGVCRRILQDPAASEEATLDVFHQVWRQAGSYDAARGTPMAWILVLARTRALDLLRSRTRKEVREAPIEAASGRADSSANPEHEAAISDRAARVRTAMGLLSADQRAAIEKAYYEGMSHSEVAQALGTPLGTVKTRIRSGLETLRLALAAEEGIA